MPLEPTTVIESLQHRVSLAGTVLWSPGEPAAGARVTLRALQDDGSLPPAPRADEAWPPRPQERLTAADGSFFFLDLADGAYRVDASHARVERGRHVAARAECTLSLPDPAGAPGLPCVTLALVSASASEGPPPEARAR